MGSNRRYSQSKQTAWPNTSFAAITDLAPAKAAACLQKGLKTGMYYLRTRAAADAIKFTVDQLALAKNKAARVAAKAAAVPVVPVIAPLKVRSALALLAAPAAPVIGPLMVQSPPAVLAAAAPVAPVIQG